MNWNHANVAILKFLVSQHNSATNISRKMNTTRSTIVAKASRLGIHLTGGPGGGVVGQKRPRKKTQVAEHVGNVDETPVKRKYVPTPRAERTRTELRAMLAEAMRNTAAMS